MKKQTLTELIDMLNVKMGKHFCLVTRSRAVYGKYNYALNIIDQDGFERGCEMLWQSRYFTADELIAALRFGLAMEYAEFRESY